MSYPPQVYESNNRLISIFWKIRWRYLQVKVHHQQCGGSGCLSLITDQKTATNERGEKKFGVITFFVAKIFTKLQIILVLKC